MSPRQWPKVYCGASKQEIEKKKKYAVSFLGLLTSNFMQKIRDNL